ncbi:MAG: putative molybdenum carrier protein [Bacteroidales bacterium]|nr:putative molybdenum carrier protein [Bacteroidales bacterium]
MLYFSNMTVISGGQTGIDRAALDVALALGLSCSGWCPKGRMAEDGAIDPKYPLRETNSPSYPSRTLRNILQSDGTLILYADRFDPGTALTMRLCKKWSRPFLAVKLAGGNESYRMIREWLEENSIIRLNIAGPRESFAPGIGTTAYEFLYRLMNS